MTPEQLQLLTAAADGELTPREDRDLRRLLAESADARKLLARLRGNADRLRRMPKAVPPANLHARVMARVAAAPAPRPVEPARPAAHTRHPGPLLPLAIAASLLVAVAGGSFLFFHDPDPARGNGPARRGGSDVAQTRPDAPTDQNVLPADGQSPPSVPGRVEDTYVIEVAPAPSVREIRTPEAIPEPRVVEPNLFGFPPEAGPGAFDRVQVRLPYLVPVGDLDRDDVRQRLAEELVAPNPVRIDLFARDTHRGLDALLAAARAGGVAVTVDAAAQDRQKRKLPAAFALYTESLTAPELRDLLTRLAADGKAGGVFNMLHIMPAAGADRDDLRTLLGIDPGLWKRPAAEPAGPRSVAAGTADQVAGALTKGVKTGIAVTYLPAAARANPLASKDVRQYLDRRGDRKPTAVPVLVVLRTAP